jgi:hypothetical protein
MSLKQCKTNLKAWGGQGKPLITRSGFAATDLFHNSTILRLTKKAGWSK